MHLAGPSQNRPFQKQSGALPSALPVAAAVLTTLLLVAPIPSPARAQSPSAPPSGNTGKAIAQPRMVEGKPVETRPPENTRDGPLFAQQTRAPFHRAAPYKVTTITDKLHLPWSLAFLPDGKFLVSEKHPAHLRIVSPDGALSPPLSGLAGLAPKGKLGLLDVVLAPDFTKSHRIYFAFFTVLKEGNSNTDLAYGVLDEAAGAVRGVTVIYRGMPRLPEHNFSMKQGGRIAFAKDGTLFMTVGDRDGNKAEDYEQAQAQKLDRDVGKIIHLTAEGKPAPDNPFLHTEGARPEIWAYGIRSPEGLAFDNQGRLWETEQGPRGGDELNLIHKGGNYGWPIITHGIDYNGKPVLSGLVAKAGMAQPVYYWDPVIAPSGLAAYHGTLFPAWKHSLFAGGLRGTGVYRLQIENGKVVAEEPMLTDRKQRIRDVRVGPEGALYVLTEQKALLKITPP